MKKVVKKSFIILAGVVLISISGCKKEPEIDNFNTINGNESVKVKVGNPGDVYVANFNFNAYSYGQNVDNFKIRNIKSREAITESYENKENINFINETFINGLKLDTARSIDDTEPVTVRKLNYQLGDTKVFNMYKDRNMNTFEEETGVCKYIGDHCVIWYIESPDVQITNANCLELGKSFDKVYEIETALIGSNIYEKKISNFMIDPSDKIEIVFSDLFNDSTVERSTEYYGYFYNADLFTKEYGEEGYKNDYSNEGQIIYIDTYSFTRVPNIVFSTVVHEFNHLLNFCVKQQYNTICDTWFTEMLAMLTEDAFDTFLETDYQYSPKSRLIKYLMEFGYVESPIYWYDLRSENVLFSYASTYALGSYLVRNFGGIDLLHEMATNKYVDIDSIEDALNKLGYVYNDTYNDNWVSFNVALKKQPLMLINENANLGEDISTINKEGYEQYHTLNRKWVNTKYPELSFEPINIRGTYKFNYYDENKILQEDELDVYPCYMNPEYLYSDYFNVQFCAYSLFYVGKNLESFKIQDIDYTYYETYYPGF